MREGFERGVGHLARAGIPAGVLLATGLAIASAAPLPGPGLPPGPPGVFSPLPAAWEAHRADPIPRAGPPRLAPPTRRAAGPSLVLGWLPYWMVPSTTLHLDLLTHVAYFGVQVVEGGELANPRHWTTGELAPLIQVAHDAGVDFVLTLICFDGSTIDAVLADPEVRAALVTRVTGMVAEGNGDGVNVDFEGLPLARKQDFVAFVGELKAALDTALGRSHVSVATPAVDWKGAYDYDELARVADALVIMGYEYHYSGGSPGPVSPLAPSERWGRYSLAWTLDDYDRHAGVENRDRIALALPLYGHDWPTVDDAVPGVALAKAASPSLAQCAAEGVRWGWRFDTPSTTPWYFISDESRQVWCEDRVSLGAKIALAADRKIAGVGFWALGYEAELDTPWDALVEAWPATGGGDPAPEASEEAGPAEGAWAEEATPVDGAEFADVAEEPLGDEDVRGGDAPDGAATGAPAGGDESDAADRPSPSAPGGCMTGSTAAAPWWTVILLLVATMCFCRRRAGRTVR